MLENLNFFNYVHKNLLIIPFFSNCLNCLLKMKIRKIISVVFKDTIFEKKYKIKMSG